MSNLRLPPLRIWLPLSVLLALVGFLILRTWLPAVPAWLAGLGLAGTLILVLHFSVIRPMARLKAASEFLAVAGTLPGIGVGGARDLNSLADDMNRHYQKLRTDFAAMEVAATAFASHQGMLITDAKGRVLRVNRAYTRLTGYSSQDLVGRPASWLLARPQGKSGYRRIAVELLRKGQWEGEAWERRKDAGPRLVWLSLSMVRDQNDTPTHCVGTTLDITDIRDERDNARRAAAEENALGELMRLAVQPVDSTIFLQRGLETLLSSVPWLGLLPKGVIFLNEPEDEQASLRMAASHNLDPALLSICGRVPLGSCICGTAAKTHQIQHTSCLDSGHVIRYAGMQPHAHCALPILANHALLGVLTLYLADGHRYSLAEETFLRRVADVLSIGLVIRQARAEVEYQAQHDPLTGLPNRLLLLERLRQEMAMARRREAYGAVLFIDLDNFKTFNDALGHASGDALLNQIACRLSQRVRAGDTLVRRGGDEFLVVLPDMGEDMSLAGYEARQVAEKLRDSLAEPIYLGGRQLHLTCSMGITLFPNNGDDPEAVLQHAEVAMYRAKQAGRDCIRFFSPEMQAAADKRLHLQNDLRHALSAGELMLHYQPQIDSQGRLRGVEALLRWQHTTQGMIPPADFIPLAEESGLILSIGHWVIQQACRQIVTWKDAGVHVGSLAVNVSARQFHQADFVARVERILEETGADPSQLELELTESLLISHLAETVDKMQVLRRRGVRFSIDDFGTGYSSLAYLKKLPLDRLKIDQSFVRELTLGSKDAAIIRAVLSVAGHLGLEVIAEGVETEAQRQALLDMGCMVFQGYHLGRPMAANALPLHLV